MGRKKGRKGGREEGKKRESQPYKQWNLSF
jgi:hypothetical protein